MNFTGFPHYSGSFLNTETQNVNEDKKIFQKNENKDDTNKISGVFDNTINNEINDLKTRDYNEIDNNQIFVANDFSLNNFLIVPGLFIPLKEDFPRKYNLLTKKQIINMSNKKIKKCGLLKKVLIKNFVQSIRLNRNKNYLNDKRISSLQK